MDTITSLTIANVLVVSFEAKTRYKLHAFDNMHSCRDKTVFTSFLQWIRQFLVSNETNDACFFKRKVWRNKSALIVEQMAPPNFDKIQEFFYFEKPHYPTACCKFDSCGSRDKCLFSVLRCHLNNVIIK